MAQAIISLWQSVLVHVVDVLLVAFVFYRLLLLIRGTRALQVLVGLVVLAVATFLVNTIFHLPLLGWILRTFWMAWAIVLAVVFQPELRSALAQLGSRRMGRLLFSDRLVFVNELVAAVQEASENRIGMLIVLEQETGLKNFVETGTVINGEVSRDLLLTLFHPRTPLHDGAVILRDDRLVAAGCVLPLSQDPNLARILGTRHRAALGISEISDAVVLVVSEETGAISVARDGKLDRQVDPAELRRRLIDFFRSLQERGLLRRSAERDTTG